MIRRVGEVWLADTATVVGDVTLAAGVNVWFGAVVRGDVARVTLGERVNLQDGVIVHCENGWLTIPNYDSATAHDADGKKIKEFKGSSDHFANFISAVRSRKYTDLNADIEQGHLSSALCHTGNISYRLGADKSPDEIADAIKSDKNATESFGRMQEHLAANDVDLAKTKATLGAWLKMDPKTERFVNNDQANAQLTRDYRKPFVVPKEV